MLWRNVAEYVHSQLRFCLFVGSVLGGGQGSAMAANFGGACKELQSLTMSVRAPCDGCVYGCIPTTALFYG